MPRNSMHVSRSLRRSRRRYELRVDTAFEAVMRGCADPRRPHGWIDEEFITAYDTLHRLGWAHSVEVWRDDNLAGGLYGVAIGGLFAAESKFYRERDASKVAVVGLVDLMRDGGATLLDVQWTTPHLESLGAVDVPRDAYLDLLAAALDRPQPDAFTAIPFSHGSH
jgi:leucyl/phenylalanyl-tRNA--protein transferase